MDETDSGNEARLAALLAALSVTTDLGHGQPPEDAMRACLLATGLARRMALPAPAIAGIYYATLLRHIGCTAYAHEEAALFGGDEIDARAAVARVDLADPRQVMAFMLFGVGRTASPPRRLLAVAAALPRAARATKELAAANCEVGEGMARRLGLSDQVQAALGQVYERWDGKGLPRGLSGTDLAPAVRFIHVAGTALTFARIDEATAVETVRRRAGGALDPAIAAVFARDAPALLAEADVADPWAAVVACEPEPHRRISETRLDGVARAFADLVDLKLPFTRGHSSGVAELAETAARAMGLPARDVVIVRRAALFHDLGRVGIPNGIWERPGRLSESDWERVRLHPYHTERILARAPALAPLARIAGMHHERQDGSGYHRQTAGAAIPMAARILAAADAYQAMTQDRPHRRALTGAAAADTLRVEAGRGRYDQEAVHAVLAAAGHRATRPRDAWPASLSDREVDVLRLIARGASYKDVAQGLSISPRTAAHHVGHIYTKIGVSTRAAAAMFAMEHDLLHH